MIKSGALRDSLRIIHTEMQAEETSKDKVELSRELASLRSRLSAVTQQAEEYKQQAVAAKPSPGVAEQQKAAVQALEQANSTLRDQLAQAKASRSSYII